MSSEYPDSQVYHTSVVQKLKSKNSAKLYRFGSPKLRDILREKCRSRVKEARQQGFSKNRFDGTELYKIDLKDILRQELAELEHDITLQDKIYQELLSEINDWFIDQFEEEDNYLVAVVESQDLVCPVCQILNLEIVQSDEGSFKYKCKCNVNFNFASNLECLRLRLYHHVDKHEQKCLTKLTFFVNPLTKQLEGICDNCDYFCSLQE